MGELDELLLVEVCSQLIEQLIGDLRWRAGQGDGVVEHELFDVAELRPVLVNGAAGVVVVAHGQPYSIMGFTVRHGRVTAIDILADPERLPKLDPAILDNRPPGRS